MQQQFTRSADRVNLAASVLKATAANMKVIGKFNLNSDDALSAHDDGQGGFEVFSHLLVNDELSTERRSVPLKINGIPSAHHTRIIPTPYDHMASNEQITTLWTAISDNDPASILYNQIRLGACTTSFTSKLYFRDVGVSGNNGKSAIQSAVMGACGSITNLNAEEIYCSSSGAKGSRGHQDAMMSSLQGTGCFVSELEQRNEKEVINEGFIKSRTGEATMTGSKKGETTRTTTIQGMVYCQSNQLINYVNKVKFFTKTHCITALYCTGGEPPSIETTRSSQSY